MRNNCRSTVLKIFRDIRQLEVNQNCKQTVLILDDITTQILNQLINQFLCLGANSITKASLKKKPQPQSLAIYYISTPSISHLINDFQNSTLYHSVNVLIAGDITSSTMQSLSQQSNLLGRLASFAEMKLETTYLSANLGLICSNIKIHENLLRKKPLPEDQIGKKLFQSIICGYGRLDSIKIHYPHQSVICKGIIGKLCEQFEQFRKQNVNEQQKQFKQLNLLVVERGMDIVSPIVRNFYYLPMICDMFGADYLNSTVKIAQKSINLNFDDQIFNKYKNLHLSRSQTMIQSDFKQFKVQNKAAQLQEKGLGHSNELKQAIREIPEFNKKIVSYGDQMTIMSQISQTSKEQNLPEIGELQQMIVSGFNGQGQMLKDKKIYARSVQILGRIKNQEKIARLIFLMICCLEMGESERKQLINKIKQLPDYSKFGLALQKNYKSIIQKPTKLKANPNKERPFLDLHQSLVGSILIDLLNENGSKLIKKINIGGESPKLSKFETKEPQKQYLVMMLGGISINQISQLQRILPNINILTDRIITPHNYLTQLTQIFC